MNKALLSTLFHFLEIAICGAIAIALALSAKKLFNIDLSAELTSVLGVALNLLAKLLRAAPSVPVSDYVNAPLSKGK